MPIECQNCNNDVMVTDYKTGDIYCRFCGCVNDRLRLVAHSFRKVFDDAGNIRPDAPIYEPFQRGTVCLDNYEPMFPKTNSAPYKRATYFAERISQWQQTEPEIPEEDQYRISYEYYDMRFPPEYILAKDDIRLILRCLNTEHQTKRFVDKYLEKWITLRSGLCGEPGYGLNMNAEFADDLKVAFNQIQIPFSILIKERGNRYSCISYNFIFRRIFDLFGCSEFGIDFPPLKNPAKRSELVANWIKLTEYLVWPYINSDENNFGFEYYVDPFKAIERHGVKKAVAERNCCSDGGQQQQQQQLERWTTEDFVVQCQALYAEWFETTRQ